MKKFILIFFFVVLLNINTVANAEYIAWQNVQPNGNYSVTYASVEVGKTYTATADYSRATSWSLGKTTFYFVAEDSTVIAKKEVTGGRTRSFTTPKITTPGNYYIVISTIAGAGNLTTWFEHRIDLSVTQNFVREILVPDSLTVNVGENKQISTVIMPSNATYKTVNYESIDNSVATVTQSGLISGVSEGSTLITVNSTDGSGAYSYIFVTVQKIPVTNISFNIEKISLFIDETYDSDVFVYPENATNKNYTFTVEDANILEINSSGVITAKSEGKTRVYATSLENSNIRSIIDVTVMPLTNEIPVDGIVLDYSELHLDINQSKKLTATVTPTDATNKHLLWSSSNPSIATVTSDGVITGIQAGETQIKATSYDGMVSAICNITISNQEILPYSINYIINDTSDNDLNNQKICVEVCVTKNNSEQNNDIFVTAIYSSDGKLIDFSYLKAKMGQDQNAIFCFDFINKTTNEVGYAKTFVLDDFSCMKPLSRAKTIFF